MTEAELSRFHLLRQQALHGVVLSPDETRELAGYMVRLEAEEHEQLATARDAQEARIADAEERIAELRRLTVRRAALVAYLRRVNEEVSAESDAINSAFQR